MKGIIEDKERIIIESENKELTEFREVTTASGVKYKVRDAISIEDAVAFVNGAVDSCYIEGEYHPEFVEFAIRHNIVVFYTDVLLPEDTNEQYLFCTLSPIVEEIIANIDTKQIVILSNSIYQKIELINDSNSAELTKKMNELENMIGELSGGFENIMSGLDKDQIEQLIKLAEGNKAQEEIGRAVLNGKTNDE